MKRYSIDHIRSDGRKPRFWDPWGFWGWFLRVVGLALLLFGFIILFCLPIGQTLPVLHEGDLEITLEWRTSDDLDLHCVDPSGEEIYFGNQRSRSRGCLDCDMNVRGGVYGRLAVEHIYWPEDRVPKGRFSVSVHLFNKRTSGGPVPFTVKVKSSVPGSPIDTLLQSSALEVEELVDVISFNIN
ncbi:MAG: hypothetical protein ACI395_09440 [Candidatus Cryptobacteroides sp.]